MNIVVKITEREALPIWTLPYVTAWRLSPDMLATRLVDAIYDHFFPQAFNLDVHGNPYILPSSQWNETKNQIIRIEQDLENEELSNFEDRNEWKMRSIEAYWGYESCYVWRDEFEKWHDQFIHPKHGSYIVGENEYTELCFNPRLPQKHAQYFKETELKTLKNITHNSHKTAREPGSVDANDLLLFAIADLLEECKLDTNDFEKSFVLYTWKKSLDNEKTRVQTANYADEAKREDRLEKISIKLKEIEWHLDGCPKKLQHHPEELKTEANTQTYKVKLETTKNESNKSADKRQSQLYILIWRVHELLSQQKKTTAQQIWNEIQYRYKKHDTEEIIQQVTANEILWCSGYGNEQTLSRRSFDKTLSNLKKNPPF